MPRICALRDTRAKGQLEGTLLNWFAIGMQAKHWTRCGELDSCTLTLACEPMQGDAERAMQKRLLCVKLSI